MSDLNEPQQQAVEHTDGALLIFAGAGSGKTRVITYRTANLIRRGVDPGSILLVTFTNKAAAEMRERMKKVVNGSLKGLVAGTFHSVCAAGLRRRASLINRTADFAIYGPDEQETVLRQVIEERGYDKKEFKVAELAESIGKQKQKGLLPSDAHPETPDEYKFVDIWGEYENWMVNENALDFEDLIAHMMRLAESDTDTGEELRSRFTHVMCDEFQDTNMTQYRLLRAFASRGNIGVVGDDDQGIYSWRGADRRIIRNFRKDYPDATVVKLEQNYRSTKHIVSSALSVIGQNVDREEKRLWTDNEDGPRLSVVGCPDDLEEGKFVADRIKWLLRAGRTAGEMAILYRTHYVSRPIEDALRLAGIPYYVVGGHTFYERKEVKDCLAYMRLATNSSSNVDLIRIINKPVRGIGAGTIKKLGEIAKRRGTSMWNALESAAASPDIRLKERQQLSLFRTMMGRLYAEIEAMRPAEATAHVIAQTGYKRMWLDEAAEASKRSDMEQHTERANKCDQVVDSVLSHERRMSEQGETATLRTYIQEVALLTERDTADATEKVAMMTVHAAKGLEFEFVFLVSFEEGIFPISVKNADDLEEERRLAYVAITRARRQLWITYTARRLKYGEVIQSRPSMFIGEMPKESYVPLQQFEYEQKERAMTNRVSMDPQLAAAKGVHS